MWWLFGLIFVALSFVRLGDECWSNSLLELWQFNETVINSLNQQQILDTIRTATFRCVASTETQHCFHQMVESLSSVFRIDKQRK